MNLRCIKPQFLICVLCILMCVSCQKEEFDDIYENPGYAIGTISTSLSLPFSCTLYYDFEIDNTLYTGELVSKGIGQDASRYIGQSYLVVYKQTDIDRNTINMRYRIESQEEFESLVEEFKTNPPKQ